LAGSTDLIYPPDFWGVPRFEVQFNPPMPFNDNTSSLIIVNKIITRYIVNKIITRYSAHDDDFTIFTRKGRNSFVVTDIKLQTFMTSVSGKSIVKYDEDDPSYSYIEITKPTREEIQTILFLLFCLASTRGVPLYQIHEPFDVDDHENNTRNFYLMGSHICGNCRESKMEMFHERNNVKAVFCGKACQTNFYK
jgi:hypothetical protein